MGEEFRRRMGMQNRYGDRNGERGLGVRKAINGAGVGGSISGSSWRPGTGERGWEAVGSNYTASDS